MTMDCSNLAILFNGDVDVLVLFDVYKCLHLAAFCGALNSWDLNLYLFLYKSLVDKK